MITIIIAGGSGTRLWPLSTSDKPKQFLSIDATGKSLLRKTYERVREFFAGHLCCDKCTNRRRNKASTARNRREYRG
ncbi:hypothetical protein IPF89_04250 [Candidatus Saccharibacteria bacterium]|nr:MAG: hypothetical protein IPF89_04250 [Candidatus Saccharibacteria bacterium]